MPSQDTARLTAKEFSLLNEDTEFFRTELVDGQVIENPASKPPMHSTALMGLIQRLSVNGNNTLGEFFVGVDVVLDNYNVRRVDLAFIFQDRSHLVGAKAIEGPPDLAVEVISPGSEKIDRVDKLRDYENGEIKNYWLVDPMQKSIDAWQLQDGRYVLGGRGEGNAILRLQPFPELKIPLSELWRRT